MDIKKILSELQALGLTQSQIASAIGCSQPSISDLSTGKIGDTRPSYKIVSGLQALARKHCISISTSKTNRTNPTEQLVRETDSGLRSTSPKKVNL